VAQTIRSEAETKKKHLATIYHELAEILLGVSEKKTAMLSEIDREGAPEKYHNVLEKFHTIDQSCRDIFKHCLHPSSLDAVTDTTHHLRETIEQLQLTPQTMNPSSSKNIDK
jgi:hypothetical protein